MEGQEQAVTNEQLVIQIKAGIDVSENMLQLWKQNSGFIHGMIRKLGGANQAEDLEQESFLALYSAVAGYDPDRGTKFLTYAEYHIRNAIQFYIWKNSGGVRVPYHCITDMRKVERFRNAYSVQNGEEPPDSLVCHKTGISEESAQTGTKSRADANREP